MPMQHAIRAFLLVRRRALYRASATRGWSSSSSSPRRASRSSRLSAWFLSGARPGRFGIGVAAAAAGRSRASTRRSTSGYCRTSTRPTGRCRDWPRARSCGDSSRCSGTRPSSGSRRSPTATSTTCAAPRRTARSTPCGRRRRRWPSACARPRSPRAGRGTFAWTPSTRATPTASRASTSSTDVGENLAGMALPRAARRRAVQHTQHADAGSDGAYNVEGGDDGLQIVDGGLHGTTIRSAAFAAATAVCSTLGAVSTTAKSTPCPAAASRMPISRGGWTDTTTGLCEPRRSSRWRRWPGDRGRRRRSRDPPQRLRRPWRRRVWSCPPHPSARPPRRLLMLVDSPACRKGGKSRSGFPSRAT